MINFNDRAKHPSIGTSLKVLKILQYVSSLFTKVRFCSSKPTRAHYPERLGCAYIANVPFLVKAFFTLVSPFIDPTSREKMKFNPRVIEDGYINPDQLMKEWDGEIEFEYKHEEYWPALIEMTRNRREQWFKRWQEMGGLIGTSESGIKAVTTQERTTE